MDSSVIQGECCLFQEFVRSKRQFPKLMPFLMLFMLSRSHTLTFNMLKFAPNFTLEEMTLN